MPRRNYERSPVLKDIGYLGFVEGLRLSYGDEHILDYFGGIPYALPPVGPFRFRRPRSLAPCYRYGHKGNPGRFAGRTGICPQVSRSKDGDADFDEDCTQLNIYIPAGEPPEGGWPVFFYIHGGFLQFGNANESPEALAPLLSETAFRCICVFPAYRLNVFGFLASRELTDEASSYNEPSGNFGFWDQRLALEWTWKNISLFGGNASQITIGGYSAGAHSVFQQLAHELYFVPDNKAIIKRAVMWSNTTGPQPKALPEHQHQFDELIAALGIPASLSSQDKLAKLRGLSAAELIKATKSMKLSEFKGCSDDRFISTRSIAGINNGDFARRMKRRGIKLLNGENRDEHNVYRMYRTPDDSYDGVLNRLAADYPRNVAARLMNHYAPSQTLPQSVKDWQGLFGSIYADMQVHGLERGFQNALVQHGLIPGVDILRYRFEKRMKCMDKYFPPAWGVTHATDMAIWFWGLDYGDGLTDAEKKELKPWNDAFSAFVKGEEVSWGVSSIREARRLRSDGKTDIWHDDQWEKGLELWKLVNDSYSTDARSKL